MNQAEQAAHALLERLELERQLIVSGQVVKLQSTIGERNELLAKLAPLIKSNKTPQLEHLLDEIQRATSINSALLAGIREEIGQRLANHRETLRACKSYERSETYDGQQAEDPRTVSAPTRD